MEKLTVKQAISKGYSYYGFSDEGWQLANRLHENIFDEIEEERHDYVVLFEKAKTFPSVKAKIINELLSEYIGEADCEESGRETEIVFETIQNIDFSSTADLINKTLALQCAYHRLTQIQLTQIQLTP